MGSRHRSVSGSAGGVRGHKVRGHKKTMQNGKIGGARNKSMQHRCTILKNDAILMRDIKKRCNIDARY
jgi:hypothetical protein